MQRLALPLVALLGLSTIACDSKSEAKPAEKADAKKSDTKSADAKGGGEKADAKPEAAAPSKLDIPKLGLKADAPAGATVSDGIGGSGVMITGENLALNLEEATDMTPKTLEDGKKEAEMYTPKNIKEEKLADGWALTYENSGSMGANYFVNVRRDIGGKAYWCNTMQSTPDQQALALAFCKSLAK